MPIRIFFVLSFCLAACSNTPAGTDDGMQPDLYGADFSYPPDLTGQGVLDLASACGPAGTACQTSTGTNGLCDGMSNCNPCTDPFDDMACDAAYGSPGNSFICVSGHCQAGQCHTSAECAGEICAGGFCATCTGASVGASDGACTSDTVYGAGFICVSGLCVMGDCHQDSDCPIGTGFGICGLATANVCSLCSGDSDCISDLDTTGSGGVASMCHTHSGDTTTGACVPSACTAGTTNCTTINSNDFCCGSAGAGAATCQTGNCCKNSDCGGSGAVCSSTSQLVAGVCGNCGAPTSPGTVYVDPVNGSDTIGTGSNVDAAGKSCSFATVTRAIQALGHPTSPVTVIVLGDSSVSLRNMASASPREALPINIPAYVTVQAATGPIGLTANRGFRFSGGPSALLGFNLTGSPAGSGIGLEIGFPVAGTVNLTNVTVTGFQTGVSIKQPTTTIFNNGVQINGNGTASLAGDGVVGDGILKINGQTASPPIQINGNSRYGLEMLGTGSVDIAGDSTVPTVTFNGNGQVGMYFNQKPNGSGNSIKGVVANDTVAGPGLLVRAGLQMKVQNSIFLGNVDGIQVTTNGTGTGGNSDVSGIVLGSAATGTARGANLVQQSFGGNPNSGAGICLDIALTTVGSAANLFAEGNVFSGPRDCSTATPGTLSKSNNCTTGVDVSVNNPLNLTTAVKITTDNCN